MTDAVVGEPDETSPGETKDFSDVPANSEIPVWVRKAIYLWWGILVSLWLSLIVMRELRGLLFQLALALFLSFALEPIVDRLERRGMSRGSATGLSLLGVLVAAVAFLTLMGQLMANQLTELVEELPSSIRATQTWLDEQLGIRIETQDLIDRVEEGAVNQYANDVSRYLLEAGSRIANILFQFLTISLFTFYLTADGPRFRQVICSVLPPRRQRTVLQVWELAITKTGAYISSRLILALLSAVFHWVVFMLLGLPSAVALALWVGVVSQFIPTLGTYLAGVLPALVALGQEPTSAIWVVVAVIAYQQVENYVFQPRITAQTLDLHPAVAIGAVLAGTSLFGGTGALLALPFVATAGGFISAYVERHDVVDSRLVTRTSPVAAAAEDRSP